VPEAYLVAIVGGVALGFVKRFNLGLSSPVASILGASFVLLGIAVMILATATAGQMKLADDVQLLTDGPYRLSRHPMYIAWTFVYIGILLFVSSGWLLILFPMLMVWVHWESGREERRLLESFGPEYAQYQHRVRRYL
jgi:protein-S-isoprenylcysteine O-methyltransferase Ste14